MRKSLLFITLLIPVSVNACMYKLLPDDKNFDKYESIFTGEVIGIQLTEYEKYRAEALKSGKKFNRWFSDITLEHEITLLVHKVITGKQPEKVVVKARGCGVHIPSMHMNGIFFKTKKGFVIPIYGAEGQHYSELLLKTGRYKALKERQNRINNKK